MKNKILIIATIGLIGFSAGISEAKKKKILDADEVLARAVEIVYCGENPSKCPMGLLPLETNGEWAVNPFEVYGPDGIEARMDLIADIEVDIVELENGRVCTTDADCAVKFPGMAKADQAPFKK